MIERAKRDEHGTLTLEEFPKSFEIQQMALKTDHTLRDHERVMCSISGGSDSDVLLDLVERVRRDSAVTYVFFDTGLEYQATRDHIGFLEGKYGIEILTHRATRPIPVNCKTYGLPFLSKEVSEKIERLQRHNFQWEDEPFQVLWARYPHCKAALRWWCNEFGGVGRFNISRNKWLKEFMVANPPDFRISPKCCDGAKKSVSHEVEAVLRPDLVVTGVRKSEGGARSVAYKSCFSPGGCAKVDQLRPLFWLVDEDKARYVEQCGVRHSDCYSVYGLKRTGCACCPFGRNFERELAAALRYEPKLYTAATRIFGKSYEYTRKYRAFCAEREEKA